MMKQKIKKNVSRIKKLSSRKLKENICLMWIEKLRYCSLFNANIVNAKLACLTSSRRCTTSITSFQA